MGYNPPALMIQQPLQVSTPSMYDIPDHSNSSNTTSGQSTPKAGASGNSTPKLGVSPSNSMQRRSSVKRKQKTKNGQSPIQAQQSQAQQPQGQHLQGLQLQNQHLQNQQPQV